MADTVETAVYRLRIEGQDQLDRLTKSIEGLAVAEEDATKATRTTSEELQRRVARYDPLIRAQQAYAKELENIARYQETGVGTQKQINALFEGATARYQAAQNATKGLADAHKGLDAAGQSAFHVMRSMAEQLAMGVPITTTLASHLNQLAFAATGEGGIAGAFKQVGTFISGMITPMTAMVTGLGAIAAAALYAVNQMDKLQVSGQRAISGRGAATGTTLADINRFASQQSGTFGTNAGTSLTQVESRKLAESLTATGDIVINKLHGMSDAVVGFANQTNVSIDKAIEAFAEIARDPVKGLDKLAEAYGPVSQEARKMVTDLVASGDKTGAFSAALGAVSAQATEAAKNMGYLEKAWRALLSLGAQPVALPRDLAGDIETVTKQLNSAIQFAGTAPNKQAASDQIQNLTEQLIKLQAELDKTKQKTETAISNKLGDDARRATDAFIPQIKQIEDLTLKLNQLREAQAKGQGGQNTAAATAIGENQLRTAQENMDVMVRQAGVAQELREKYQGMSLDVAKTLQLNENNLPVVEAIGGAAKIAAQYEADIKNALLEGKSLLEAQALAASNRKAAFAAVNSASKETTWQLNNQLGVSSAVGGAEKMRAQYTATVNRLMHDGVSAANAQAQAWAEMRNTQAQINAGALQQLDTLKDQYAVAAAVTGQQKIQAQYQATYNKLLNDGVSQGIAAQVAAQEQVNAIAAANAAISNQVHSLEQSTELIKAQADGTEATVKAAQAYDNAIRSGADNTHAAALYAATLTNELTRAAVEADKVAVAAYNAKTAADLAFVTEKGIFAATGGMKGTSATFDVGLDTRLTAASGIGNFLRPIQTALAQQASRTNAPGIDQSELVYGTIDGKRGYYSRSDLTTAQNKLTDSIDKLTSSTDSLNATNQELLSPYYTQDPRTSHIGFRSQGMAAGGYVDVPGLPSANDNLLATIPVASGERIYVDPMSVKRGSSGTTINITAPMMFSGPVNRDEVGRTVYQNMQMASRSIAAAQR